jgi:plastocyanin
MSRLTIVVVTLLLSLGTARAACTDAAAVAATRAAADALCPCGTFRSHKAYLHCVARVAKAAALSGSLPKACRATVLGCAKKSTCGKAGFVTCCRTTAKGSTKCVVKPSAAKCTAPKGGSACVGRIPSCCYSCAAGSCAEATTTITVPRATSTTTRPRATSTTTMSGATTTTTLPRPQTHTVMVGEGGALVFTPANLTIHVGDTVRWVWGSPGHSVVSGTDGNADNRFCSPSDSGCANPPLSNQGATYEHTFAHAGTFPYYCSVHFSLGMTGTITVQ